MRQVINISLPKNLSLEVDKMVKEGKFATKSEFFRDLLRMRLEGRILKDLVESQREFDEGKGKLLRSLSDLD